MMRTRRVLATTAVGAAAIAAAALVSRFLPDVPPIPEPPTDAMEAQVAEKLASARQAVADDSRSGDAWGRLGMIFHAHYLESEAGACYAEAHRLDPEDFRWPYLLARILKSQDPRRALDMLEAARRLKADYAPIHLLAAELHEAEGDSAAAMDAYLRALSVDRGSAAAELGIGRLALAKGELAQSETHLERAAELAPEAGSIQSALSQLYHRLGRKDEATQAAARARRLHPDIDARDPVTASVMEEAVSIVGYQNRALETERAGDASRAEALLRRAIELRPDDASLRYNLGNHLSRQGRFPEAEDSYRLALKREEGHVPSLVNLGILEAQKGRVGDAKGLFEKALEKEPAHPGALLGLGNVAAAQGQLEEAIPLFRKSLDADPERPDAHYALGKALAARGDLDEAVEHFLAALELAPERGEIHLDIARIHANRRNYLAARRDVQLARGLGVRIPEDLSRVLDPPSKRP